MSDLPIVKIPAVRYKGGEIEEITEPVVIEEKITLYLNGKSEIFSGTEKLLS